MRMLAGIETEFAGAGFGDGHRTPRDVARALLERARTSLPCLPDGAHGVFLATGGRLLIDNGAHLEYATPEALTPEGIVTAVRAGEHILAELVRGIDGAMLGRTNQCYLTGATYGSHENHCITGDIYETISYLMVHLVTRQVYTGAGGLDPASPGIRFVISPRALHFRPRGIFLRTLEHPRDEPHAGRGYRRLHITLGDTLAFDRPLFLRVGTTALLIALVEHGHLRADELPHVVRPGQAIVRIARDATLRARVTLTDGTRPRAIEVQRRLCATAARAASRIVEPPAWVDAVLGAWQATLDALVRDPEASGVEWAVKRRVFNDQAERAGFTPRRLDAISADLERAAARGAEGEDADAERAADGAEELHRILQSMAARRLCARQRRSAAPPDVRALREWLCRLDFMFSALPRPIADLVRDPRRHAVPAVTPTAIERATQQPPEPTRATVRARVIRRSRASILGYRVGWAHIDDLVNDKHLPMPDPFGTSFTWRSLAHRRRAPSNAPLAMLSEAYNRGDYRSLKHLLATFFPGGPPTDGADASCLPYFVWAESRTGNVARAEHALRCIRTLPRGTGLDQEIAGLYAAMYRFQGLTPSARIWRWIRRADALPRAAWCDSGRVSYLGHKAVALRCAGRVGEAIEVLRESLEVRLDASNHQRIHARNRCDLADCLRIVGRTGEAGEHVDHAGRIFARHQFDGEHADHYLLVLAKIEGGRAALAHLAAARRVLWTRGHTNGLVRAELLRARLDPSPATARRARAAVLRTMARVPDLRTCPRLRGILRRWERWVGGEGGKPADPFWYL